MENQEKKQTPEIKLDRKSKILFVVIGLLIIGSVAVTYYRYMMKRDYIVQAQIDCDPTTENCFIWKCDQMSLVEGEACTGVPDNDIWYYKIFRRNAKNIPDCDPKDENCTAYVCNDGEKDCAEELCAAQNVSKKESCNDPVQYNIDNPPTEESTECAPDDEECLSAQEDTECAPDDQECLDAKNAECDPASEDCTTAPADENSDNQETPANNVDSTGKNVPPAGVEPN